MRFKLSNLLHKKQTFNFGLSQSISVIKTGYLEHKTGFVQLQRKTTVYHKSNYATNYEGICQKFHILEIGAKLPIGAATSVQQ